MFFQTQREAAGYIASKLADTRKEAVKVSLPLRELNTAPLLGMILEADPRLLFCLEGLAMETCEWKNRRSVSIRAKYTQILPSSVITASSEDEIEGRAYRAVLLHQKELRMVLPAERFPAAEEKIQETMRSILDSWRFMNCGLKAVQVGYKRMDGCRFCGVRVQLQYSYGYQEMRRRAAQMASVVSQIASMARRAGREDWRQAYAVVRYCVANWRYGSLPASQGEEFTAYGALVNRKAVCMGISLAVCEIFGELGIPCRYMHGNRRGGRHGWNLVYVKGGWFYIDVTDSITMRDPLYGWGITELRDRTVENPPLERLRCGCDKDFLRRAGVEGVPVLSAVMGR